MTDGREIIRGIIPHRIGRGHATEGGEERERGKTDGQDDGDLFELVR